MNPNIADTEKKVKGTSEITGEKSVDREKNMSIIVCTMGRAPGTVRQNTGRSRRPKDVIE